MVRFLGRCGAAWESADVATRAVQSGRHARSHPNNPVVRFQPSKQEGGVTRRVCSRTSLSIPNGGPLEPGCGTSARVAERRFTFCFKRQRRTEFAGQWNGWEESVSKEGLRHTFSGGAFCRVNAVFHSLTERRIYAEANASVTCPSEARSFGGPCQEQASVLVGLLWCLALLSLVV